MMNLNRVTGDIRPVLSVPAAVHVETVTVGVLKNKIVARLVTGAGPARTGNMVTAPVEKVRLDERVSLVKAYTVSQTGTLIVVDIVVVNMCLQCSTLKKDPCVTPTPKFAVVHLQVRMCRDYPIGVGNTVVSSFLV